MKKIFFCLFIIILGLTNNTKSNLHDCIINCDAQKNECVENCANFCTCFADCPENCICPQVEGCKLECVNQRSQCNNSCANNPCIEVNIRCPSCGINF